MTSSVLLASCALLAALAFGEVAANSPYYGKHLGSLSTLEHRVSGQVYAVDSKTLHIRNFNYDGQAPDAYFYVGSGTKPSNRGHKVADENGSLSPLRAYRNRHITLTLPDGVTLDKVQWISVWCKQYSVDFGNLILPAPVTDYPRPQRLGQFGSADGQGVSSQQAVAVDSQTLLVPGFSYDGQAPDAHFWAGKGYKPSDNGFIVPNENGNDKILGRYERKTIVLTLPDDKTIFDIDYLSVWCSSYKENLGHLKISHRSLNVPPSLRILGVRPQSKLNCELLDEERSFEVRWAVAGDSIVMQLVGRLDDNQYMAFGVSGSATESMMEGGDVVVAWMNRHTGHGHADDYFLTAKSQCKRNSGIGACRDVDLQGGINGVRLLNSAYINGYSMLTFQRSLSSEDRHDATIYTNRSQPVIWAIGPLSADSGVLRHTSRLQSTLKVDFGRRPVWNCPTTTSAIVDIEDRSDSTENAEQQGTTSQFNTASSYTENQVPSSLPSPDDSPSLLQDYEDDIRWQIPAINCNEPDDGVLYAQIGPSGGRRGLGAITGQTGWGVAWYINGLLVPEISVVRGRTYTFVVEGGANPERPAKYHPFYITDDPVGGYQFKTDEERAAVRVLAGVGVTGDGHVEPTAVGRLCEWLADPAHPADTVSSFGAFQRTLSLDCQRGQPGILQWTPDQDTPDTVYYQCYTHRYLGWKINVLDSCHDDQQAPQTNFNDINRMIQVDYPDYFYYDDNVAQHSVLSEQTFPHNGSYSAHYYEDTDDLGEPFTVTAAGQAHSSTADGQRDFERVDNRPSEGFGHRLAQDPHNSASTSEEVAVVYSQPQAQDTFNVFASYGAQSKSGTAAQASGSSGPTDSSVGSVITGSIAASDESRIPASSSGTHSRRRLRPSATRTQPPSSSQHRRNRLKLRRTSLEHNSDIAPTSITSTNPEPHSKISEMSAQSHDFESKPPLSSRPNDEDFDPEDIVFETGFTPVRHVDQENPSLAFEVKEAEPDSVRRKYRIPPIVGTNPQHNYINAFSHSSSPQAVNVPLPVSLVPAAPSFPKQNLQQNVVERIDSSPAYFEHNAEPAESYIEYGPIPPPPHLTKEILADALVFSPHELPSNYRPVSHNHPPFRRQQHQQSQNAPPPRRPTSFIDNLLSYIPGLGGYWSSRKKPTPAPAIFPRQNPNRMLNGPMQGAPLGMPAVLRPGPALYRAPASGLRSNRNTGREVTRRHALPSQPEMQPVIESSRFQPSPVDSAGFRPVQAQQHEEQKSGVLTDVEPIALELTDAHIPKQAAVSKELHDQEQQEQSSRDILHDVWDRLKSSQ